MLRRSARRGRGAIRTSRRRHLIIFVKEPKPGRVKTRLARGSARSHAAAGSHPPARSHPPAPPGTNNGLGYVRAARIYRSLVQGTLRRLAGDRRWQTWLAVSPDGGWSPRAVWSASDNVSVIGQGRGDLGDRMARAIASRPAGPVVLIGSDVPGIRNHEIATAFALLGRQQVVFGPAEDGGYWLVGFRRSPVFRSPFAGVAWSQPTTLAETVDRISVGDGIAMLSVRPDIDTPADWIAYTQGAALRRGHKNSGDDRA